MALDAGRFAERVASFAKTVNIVLPIPRLRSLKNSPTSAFLA